jgi:hypothetical protein
MGTHVLRSGCLVVWMAVLGLSLFAPAAAADSANYDTAWTFVYHGGKTSSGKAIPDNFRDVKVLPTGEAVCVGQTVDSDGVDNALLVKLSPSGKVLAKKYFRDEEGDGATSLLVKKSGEFVVGGYRLSAPLLLRLDPSFNLKGSTWYYDSTLHKHRFSRSSTINSMVEAKDGRILAAAGDFFPDNNRNTLNNFAAFLQYDSLGAVKSTQEWLNTTGYELGGWALTPSEAGGYMLGGNRSVFLLDTLGQLQQKVDYSFSLPGVGSEVNNVTRVHQLRSGMVMVAGQSYEEDCWTKYQRLSYDAWWSPLGLSGNDDYRYTAGVSGADDVIYDFTQLADGKIVFVGIRQSFDQIGGVWAVVTDSMGKDILWQKQFRIPYGKEDGSALKPWTVAASPDSGFTVVGLYGLPDSSEGQNAFAAHFVPKPLPASILHPCKGNAHPFIGDRTWTFAFAAPSAGEARLDLFTTQGIRVARFEPRLSQAGQGEIRVESSPFKAGAYVWQLRVGSHTSQGFIVKSDL